MRILIVNNYIGDRGRAYRLKSVVSLLHPTAQVSMTTFDEGLSEPWKQSSCLILSGSSSMLANDRAYPKYVEESKLISESSLPILGICFGHQLIARTFGVPIIDLKHRFEDFNRIKVLVPNAIFNGLPTEIEVCESHREIVSPNLNGLVKTASAQAYEVEALRHPKRPIFGVQFHPERFDESHPAGRKVLENFLSLVVDEE